MSEESLTAEQQAHIQSTYQKAHNTFYPPENTDKPRPAALSKANIILQITLTDGTNLKPACGLTFVQWERIINYETPCQDITTQQFRDTYGQSESERLDPNQAIRITTDDMDVVCLYRYKPIGPNKTPSIDTYNVHVYDLRAKPKGIDENSTFPPLLDTAKIRQDIQE